MAAVRLRDGPEPPKGGVMAERFSRPRPVECMIDGVHASVMCQIGSNASVLFSKPSEGEQFEVRFAASKLARLVDAAENPTCEDLCLDSCQGWCGVDEAPIRVGPGAAPGEGGDA